MFHAGDSFYFQLNHNMNKVFCEKIIKDFFIRFKV